MNTKILIFVTLLSSLIYAEDNSIKTSSGITFGYYSDNTINWDDIPYAKPPVGELRWKIPQKINKPNNILFSKIIIFAFKSRLGWVERMGKGISLEQRIVYTKILRLQRKSLIRLSL